MKKSILFPILCKITALVLFFILTATTHLFAQNDPLEPDDPKICFSGLPTRGDSNGDGHIDISDPVNLLMYLFMGADLACKTASDTNGDGNLDIADALRTLRFLFLAEEPPVIQNIYDFDLGPPFLYTYTLDESPNITLTFTRYDETLVVPYYPSNIFREVQCSVTAVGNSQATELITANLDEDSKFTTLENVFGPDYPLKEGIYQLILECVGPIKTGRIEGRLEIQHSEDYVEEPLPGDSTDGPGVECTASSEVCCEFGVLAGTSIRDDPIGEEGDLYYCSGNPAQCGPINMEFPDGDKERAVPYDCCNLGSGQGECVSGQSDEAGGGAGLGLDLTGPPPPLKCVVDCVTILHKDFDATCNGQRIIFPLDWRKYIGWEYVGVDTTTNMRRFWDSDEKGLGANQGHITQEAADDPQIKPENELMEKLGFGFLVAATFKGIDDQGNTSSDVDPRNCRNYHFKRNTQRRTAKSGASRSRYYSFGQKSNHLVSGSNSISLLQLEDDGQLHTKEELNKEKHIKQDITQIASRGCPVGGGFWCSGDYYKFFNEDSDGTEDEEDQESINKPPIFTFGRDPNSFESDYLFVKGYDLNPPDGVKKLFWYVNPSLNIDKKSREWELLNPNGLRRYDSSYEHLMIVEDEDGQHKIECEMGVMTLRVEGDNETSSRKTVTPPTKCQCAEYRIEGEQWQMLGFPWDCKNQE